MNVLSFLIYRLSSKQFRLDDMTGFISVWQAYWIRAVYYGFGFFILFLVS